MIEVEIQNFQSIDKIAFRIEGFTAIVGRSNIGKSAVVRAIKYALTGASGTDFVRHGDTCERRLKGNKTCSCTSKVVLKTSEMALTWEKGDKTNRYTVKKSGDAEPVLYTKVGKGTPEFLQPEFAQVKVGDKNTLIQVSDQFEPIFLLKESGGAVADVLADVAKLDDINVAMRMVVKDRREASSTRKVREKDIKVIEADLATYEGLDAVTTRAERVEAQYLGVQKAEAAVGQLDAFLDTLRGLAVVIRGMTKANAPCLPDGGGLQSTGAKFIELSSFCVKAASRRSVVRKLSGVDKLTVPATNPLHSSLAEAQRLEGWLGQIRSFKQDLEAFEVLDGLPEPTAAGTQDLLRKVQVADELISRFDRLTRIVSDLENQLAAAEVTESELQAELDELGLCPTCSLPLHPGRHHEGAA